MQTAQLSALREAINLYEEGKRIKRPIGFTVHRFHPPKLRTLTLAVQPLASVHKTVTGLYQCKVDGKVPPRCGRLHPTGLEAWASLARMIVMQADAAEPIIPAPLHMPAIQQQSAIEVHA